MATTFPHMLAVFGPWDWGIVGIYFVLVMAVGFFVGHRRAAGEREFFLGNRSMPAWAVSISLVATMLSAVTFVGVPDIAYGGDISYLILNLGCIIAVFIVAIFFVPRLYRAGTVTIYGFLAQRFGEEARLAVSCAFIGGRMLSSGARLFTAAIPLCLLLFASDVPTKPQLMLAIALIGIVGTMYATAGGVRAVVWVDTIQFVIVIGTALLTVWILLHRIDGLYAAPRVMPPHLIMDALGPPGGPSKLRLVDFSLDPTREFTVWTAIIGNTFLMTAALGVDHDLAQRFLITRSAFRGSLSLIASQLISIPVVALFLVIGLLLYVYNTHLTMGGHFPRIAVYPHFLISELPTGLAGLAIVGFFAIAQGSLDSAMNALAASIIADVVEPLRRRRMPRGFPLHDLPEDSAPVVQGTPARAPRLAVAAVGVGMTGFAMACALLFDSSSNTILSFVLGLMPFAYSGMLAVFVTALFTRRGNTASVIGALVTGAATAALLNDRVLPLWTGTMFHTPVKLAWPWWMPAATLAAFAVCLMGSAPKARREFPLERAGEEAARP